jgi:hypothetical protein
LILPCSVLIHLLPGLAMAAHHHVPPHTAVPGTTPALTGTWDCGVWLLAAPLAFYMAWQAAYYFAVQVLARRYICQHKMDTSYRCLTRRAQRANNVWARIVLRGSTHRRIFFYGLLQLAFTGEWAAGFLGRGPSHSQKGCLQNVYIPLFCWFLLGSYTNPSPSPSLPSCPAVATLLLFLPTYHYPLLAAAWQAVKFLVPGELPGARRCPADVPALASPEAAPCASCQLDH